jgi:hypothetical protein
LKKPSYVAAVEILFYLVLVGWAALLALVQVESTAQKY